MFLFRILLTCVLREHNSKLILEKILLGIEKVLTTFSIPNKTFPKIDLLTGPFFLTHAETLSFSLLP